ncbi:hypothetical protein NQ317_001351 [Molorchus minor]|uniref:RAP domain-containing protein n=1 Tax=Molorchus minor TaxID=1323400 RepID=A0ABQ9JPZ8_9CUCU|nr:hypothetical protein NQ317_001351 [Molorchus minor]
MIRNIPTLNFSRCFYFVRFLSSASGEISRLTSTPVPDILLQNLKNAPTPKIVLKIINEHSSIMNSKHVMQALRSLFDLQKFGSSDVSTKELLRHPDFSRLCKKLKSQSGVIDLNETIEALKVVSYVGVPSNSTIVQVLLQLIRQNINSLTLQHIMFLEFLINQFNSSPLTEAFKIALPLIFETQLPYKMNRDDAAHLAEYLHYASKIDLSKKSINMIVEALCKPAQEFDAKTAKSIIWSITDMDEPSEDIQPLLNKAINALLVHIDELNYTDIETTLTKLIHRYSRRHYYFYSEVFTDTCANYVIDHDLGFRHAVFALRKLGRVMHVHRRLLDYAYKKAFEDPNCIESGDPSQIYSLAIATSLTCYRPTHWDAVKNLIIKKKDLAAENKKEIIWLRFAASLCLLDIYKIDILTRALNVDYLKALFTKRPDLTDILPSKYDPQNVINLLKRATEFPLQASLQHGFGGEQYVLSNLLSKQGHQIDHAVLYRKGEYPVAIDRDVEFIEDIEVQSKGELLLILVFHPIHYTINTKELRQTAVLSIKTLELAGYNVMPVNLEAWEALNDFEKIPYLMQNIKNKMESVSNDAIENR